MPQRQMYTVSKSVASAIYFFLIIICGYFTTLLRPELFNAELQDNQLPVPVACLTQRLYVLEG